ncbi:sulfide:quinone oxidoreductase [Actinoplanes campanulatus]|uniref:Sulfide:quinone oxidoreductase n=1 Tax=Actinoplanes campanulatus TaxID=113559 RepID=A0A7W5ASG3_9ACTN|nr:FAD-dependent oxidoreductase [Actinoplanes campanulatus]MBB3101511.1 sulfide:quinone oxidoreductase [Actinoplanes campanulatus]GGN50504.1 sulfide-quinone reductase [Actinoplanes campanulatus]GID42107.1 sulfide-quinone reductase [Actinoplanes campanulatus]
MRAKVLVLGGNFGGLTAAISLRDELHGDVDVTVLSDRDHFLFSPSLIWLPFGKRDRADITFPVAPTFEQAGVEFVVDAAAGIDPLGHIVRTVSGAEHHYDYLLIATGARDRPDAVEGLRQNAYSITTLDGATRAGEAWRAFRETPGDIVIGATQEASCFGAAYEFLFNTSYQLRRAGLKRRTRITYVTAEPFLGHFGIGGLPHGEKLLGMFLKKENIDFRTDTALETVDEDAVVTTGGERIPFRFAMIVPPFAGQEFLTATPGLTNPAGYVEVRDTYQSLLFDDVYAVGLAAAVQAPWTTPTPVGVPKTGLPTERMAHVAARNIAAQIRGEAPADHQTFGEIPAVCVMDAGNNGVLILADRMLPPRRHGVLVPGPQNHAFKIAFEKYYLWKMRAGHVSLP